MAIKQDEIEVRMLNISSIFPNPDQPRKYFAADKMRSLEQSIQKHGIRSPLTVEDMGSGKFRLSNGERRFRAATKLGMTKVPAIIETPKNELESLIVQFNIQEQNEGWSPVEKANAILKIAEQMGATVAEVVKLLNVPERTGNTYAAFAGLVDRDSFMRSEVPIDYAQSIRGLRVTAMRLSKGVLEEEFTRSDEKKLENRVLDLILSGDITNRGGIVRIKDSFIKNPKLIREFLTSKITSLELYKKAKAQGAYSLRNAFNSASYLTSHGSKFLELRDVKLSHMQVQGFKRAAKIAQELAEMGSDEE